MPNLRFPEFSGEWKKSILKAECEINPKTGPLADTFQYIDLESVVKGQLIKVNYLKKEDAPSRAQRVLSKWDILYQCVRPYQLNNFLVRDNSSTQRVASTGYAQIRTNNNPDFFFQLLHTQKFTGRVINRCTGTNYPAINSTDLSEIEINIPEIKEQEKIGRMLSLIDQRIAIQNRIIEDLKKLRTTLNNRFHNSFGEGVVTCFEELGKSYSGLSGKGAEDFEKGYPFITYTNVFNHSFISDEDMGYVRIKAEEHQNHVEHGDLLLTLSSETPEEVGIGAVYLGNRKPLYLNSFCIGIHINRKDIVLPTYLPYLVESKMFRKFIFPLAQGSTRYNLQKSDFEKKKIVLPTLEAQISITRILDSITSKLSLEQEILTKLLMSKNALLSKMFI